MTGLTLESLAERVNELELQVAQLSTKVGVPPPKQPAGEQRSFVERYRNVIGKAPGLPEDAAANVDHYLYGHPKQP